VTATQEGHAAEFVGGAGSARGRGLGQVRDTAAEHLAVRDVLAVLVVDEVLGVVPAGDLPALLVPLVEAARAPVVADEVTGDRVADDTADVALHLELLVDVEGLEIDAVDDGAAVGAVLGHGNPHRAPVGVDAAGVVHVALAQDDVPLQVSLAVQHEHVADAAAGGTVVTALRGGVLLRRLDDLDRGQEDAAVGLDHPLGVVGREVELQLAGGLPAGVAIDRVERPHQGAVLPAHGCDGPRRGCGGVLGRPAAPPRAANPAAAGRKD
jgi:hypothetical protein